VPKQASEQTFGAQFRLQFGDWCRELGTALAGAGILSLDEQARVLGLPRSTTGTILRGNHKSSGLSTAVINERRCYEPRLFRDHPGAAVGGQGLEAISAPQPIARTKRLMGQR
jgi:hypothetical protein